MESDSNSISFLDTLMIKDDLGNLKTILFRKPTAGNTILRSNIFHPVPLQRAIPFGQYLCLKRICSHEEDFRHQAGLL